MSVREAVEGELRSMPSVAESAIAAAALAMAARIDDPATSATASSMCAAKLIDAMQALKAQAPPAKTSDAIDDLTKRRVERRAKPSASARS